MDFMHIIWIMAPVKSPIAVHTLSNTAIEPCTFQVRGIHNASICAVDPFWLKKRESTKPFTLSPCLSRISLKNVSFFCSPVCLFPEWSFLVILDRWCKLSSEKLWQLIEHNIHRYFHGRSTRINNMKKRTPFLVWLTSSRACVIYWHALVAPWSPGGEGERNLASPLPVVLAP